MLKKIGLAVLLGALSLGVLSSNAEARGFGGGRGGGHGGYARGGGGGYRGGGYVGARHFAPVRRDFRRRGWERPVMPYGYVAPGWGW